MTRRALVIGGGIEGVQAALDIANSGIAVSLIEQSSCLHVEAEEEALLLQPKLLAAASHPNIQIFTDTDVLRIDGTKGSFRAKVLRNAQYVNAEACVSCGRCEQACPVNLLSQFSGRGPRAIHRPAAGLKSVPSAYVIDKEGIPPCTAACPAGINVQGYVALISKGLFKEAADLIREAVPFPQILGRVCTYPCEAACTRGKIDQPIAIASLKRFVADSEPTQYVLTPSEIAALPGKARVAIIGSGPAGLTCARDLVRFGHRPTVFEALPVAGGMIAVGMPRFRLPREVREAEINALINSGIAIKTSTPIGKDLTLDDLRQQGYEAIFIATGAHKNQKLNIPGEELDGVIDSIAFLQALNLKQPISVGFNVAVIGGGYTAVDSARTAIRLHCERVRLLYRRTAEEMAATKAEILETTEEGVEIEYLVSPTRIIGKSGKVVGLECQQMRLGDLDETGRRRPIPIRGSEFILDTDTVITAIGQLPDLEVLNGNIHLDNNGETLVADPLTMSTNVPGIFAGGDVVSGPESIVEAVAAGRRAAVSIDRYLRGADMAAGRTTEKPKPVEVNLDEVKAHPGERRRIPCLPIEERVGNFEEVETGYTNWMALREAKRCLNCGGCSECLECVRACELEAIDHGMQPEEIELDAGAIVFAVSPEEIAKSRLSKELNQKGVYTTYRNSRDKDISHALTQASAIASRVMADLAEYPLDRDTQKPKLAPEKSWRLNLPDSIGEPRIGVFVCRCGGGISDIIDVPRLVGLLRKHRHVAYAQDINYACSDEGATEIREAAQRYGIELTHAVVAACSCCALDQICFSCSDRRMECKAKLLGQSQEHSRCYEFVNIREHCAWVHANEPQKAMDKAKAIIGAGIARVRESQRQETRMLEVERAALIIGGGFGGLQAAADLAAQGFPVTLFRHKRHPAGKRFKNLEQRLQKDLKQHGARILDGAQLSDMEGSIGDYKVAIQHQGKLLCLSVGAAILDVSAISEKSGGNGEDSGQIAQTKAIHLPPLLEKALRNGREAASMSQFELDQTVSRMPGIFICGTGMAKSDVGLALTQGAAAASKVSALLSRGEVQVAQTVATIDPRVCRGCGTCTTICEFGAASLVEKSPGAFVARIDEGLCRGCGTCVAHCPSGALSQNGLSHRQITAALEAMLA